MLEAHRCLVRQCHNNAGVALLVEADHRMVEQMFYVIRGELKTADQTTSNERIFQNRYAVSLPH